MSAYSHHPPTKQEDFRWFLFIEADTYISFRNTLLWLSPLDSEEKLYLGSPSPVGDGPAFAHGGSGFVVSAPALRDVVSAITANPEKFVRMTQEDAYGDDVVSKAFGEVGISLTGVWPVMQGETPWSQDFAVEEVWCAAGVSWHRFTTPAMVKQLYEIRRNVVG